MLLFSFLLLKLHFIVARMKKCKIPHLLKLKLNENHMQGLICVYILAVAGFKLQKISLHELVQQPKNAMGGGIGSSNSPSAKFN